MDSLKNAKEKAVKAGKEMDIQGKAKQGVEEVKNLDEKHGITETTMDSLKNAKEKAVEAGKDMDIQGKAKQGVEEVKKLDEKHGITDKAKDMVAGITGGDK